MRFALFQGERWEDELGVSLLVSQCDLPSASGEWRAALRVAPQRVGLPRTAAGAPPPPPCLTAPAPLVLYQGPPRVFVPVPRGQDLGLSHRWRQTALVRFVVIGGAIGAIWSVHHVTAYYASLALP